MRTIVVHGHMNNGKVLSDDSTRRCRVLMYNKNEFLRDRIICTGGLFNAKQQGIKNSTACKNWLQDACLTYSLRPIEELDSITTINDVEEAVKLIPLNNNIIAITSNYHILRTWLIWKLIGKRKVHMKPASAKTTFSKLFVEVVGIIVVLCYWAGFKFPELYFRKKSRTL